MINNLVWPKNRHLRQSSPTDQTKITLSHFKRITGNVSRTRSMRISLVFHKMEWISTATTSDRKEIVRDLNFLSKIQLVVLHRRWKYLNLTSIFVHKAKNGCTMNFFVLLKKLQIKSLNKSYLHWKNLFKSTIKILDRFHNILG